MSEQSAVLCLVGPTASGKTAAALLLARMMEKAGRPLTIINADSRQVYRDFPIITAQPSEEEQRLCPHRLYGWLKTEEKISAGQWAVMADMAIQETLAAGRTPLLAGGTGFYLRALFDGIAAIPAIDAAITQRLTRECEEIGAPALHERLVRIDHAYAAKIHPNDRQRCIRALEVWEGTGKTFSWWHSQASAPSPYRILRIGVGLPLEELSPLLERRISFMLENGAIDEARRALKSCQDTSAPGWSGIGCAEAAAYLAGKLTLEECTKLWAHNTRAYAKRQWTWFRADKRIAWFRPEEYSSLEDTVRTFLGVS